MATPDTPSIGNDDRYTGPLVSGAGMVKKLNEALLSIRLPLGSVISVVKNAVYHESYSSWPAIGWKAAMLVNNAVLP